MKKLLKYSCISVSRLIQIILVLCLSAGIIVFAYILLHSQLNSDKLLGSDDTSAYIFVEWLNKYYPNYPYWFPLQGGGVSFVAGYPHLAHTLVITISRVFDLALIRSFNIMRFLAFPTTAVFILLFCWLRLNYPKQPISRIAIGFVAAIFYLIMPITYIFAYQWGFYAEAVSYIFVAPTLFFVDWFLELHFKGQSSLKKRVVNVVAILLWTLAFHTHFAAGIAILHLTIFMIAGRIISEVKANHKIALKKGCIAFLLLLIPLGLFFSHRFFQYSEYNAQVAKGGFNGYVNDPNGKINFDVLPTYEIMLGLENPKDEMKSAVENWSAQPYIWVGILPALLFGWFRTKKILLFSLLSVYGFLNFTNEFFIRVPYWLAPFTVLFDYRTVWIAYRVILPITAAFGFYILGDTILRIADILLKKTGKYIYGVWDHIFAPSIAICVMFILIIYAANMYPIPQGTSPIENQKLWRLGPSIFVESNFLIDSKQFSAFQSEDSTNNELAISKKQCLNIPSNEISARSSWCNSLHYSLIEQVSLKRLPSIKVLEKGPVTYVKETDKEPYKFLGDDPLKTRFDLSGNSGSIIMKMPLYTDVSQTQIYINTLTLFSALWNYQSSVMYAYQPIYQKVGILSEIAKYYGYNYIQASTTAQTPPEIYEQDPNWEKTEDKQWWQFKEATTLTTWTKKPHLLFIGNEGYYFYDQAFKVFNVGALSYNDGIISNGGEYVDKYSLKELQEFDGLFLSGYKYNNQNKGHSLLTQYVEKGGKLFIDTGWQYKNPDWQLEQVPPFLPTNKLIWEEITSQAELTLDQTEKINFNSDQRQIGHLTLNGGHWGISTITDLRKDSTVLLQVLNKPVIIAREFGKGKVVWSGMNILPHIEGGKNENTKEIQLLSASLKWLLGSTASTDLQIIPSRKNPDKITFKLEESTNENTLLYFREGYVPKWNATLTTSDNKTKKLQIVPTGPRMVGIVVPPVAKGSIVNLQIKSSLMDYATLAVGILTVPLLILYILGVINPIAFSVKNFVKRFLGKIKRTNKEIANYKMHTDPNKTIND